MKNEISFYYNLNPITIHQQQDKIIFYEKNKKYILYKVEEDIAILEEKYKLHNYLMMIKKYCHKIIPNISGNIMTQIRNNQYVLVEINIKTRKIKFDDLMYLMKFKINEKSFIKIKRDEWKKLWERKIDYIEYQYDNKQKGGNNLKEDIDFFVGITENCISLINEIKVNTVSYTISHDRLSFKTTTDEFYNPLKFIIDIRVRDVAEYIKKIDGLENKIIILKKLLQEKNIDENEILMLFIRIMFPSDFFDLNEKNISKHSAPKKKNIMADEYLEYIKKIYLHLKDIVNFPYIEWLNAIN